VITRSFKEFEAQASLARLLSAYRGRVVPPLIVASTGNTGNAYSFLSTLLGLRLFLVVPETGLNNLLLPFRSAARVLVTRGDYWEAIQLAESLQTLLAARTDGGVRNVARRAGMGTVYLNAVVHPTQGTYTLFDHYFQAIGSGSGAIAAWEAVENLLADGRFGTTRTHIHVAQNEPFTPVPDAWAEKSHTLRGYPPEEAKSRIGSVTASVLSNRSPAYSVAGGLRDTLIASRGAAWKVNNSEIFDAGNRFRESEGMSIAPAGAVAVAALIKAVASHQLSPEERILLHVTGGGKDIEFSGGPVFRAEPVGVVNPSQIDEAFSLLQDHPLVTATINP